MTTSTIHIDGTRVSSLSSHTRRSTRHVRDDLTDQLRCELFLDLSQLVLALGAAAAS
jgi:hypothetical protein